MFWHSSFIHFSKEDVALASSDDLASSRLLFPKFVAIDSDILPRRASLRLWSSAANCIKSAVLLRKVVMNCWRIEMNSSRFAISASWAALTLRTPKEIDCSCSLNKTSFRLFCRQILGEETFADTHPVEVVTAMLNRLCRFPNFFVKPSIVSFLRTHLVFRPLALNMNGAVAGSKSST